MIPEQKQKELTNDYVTALMRLMQSNDVVEILESRGIIRHLVEQAEKEAYDFTIDVKLKRREETIKIVKPQLKPQ